MLENRQLDKSVPTPLYYQLKMVLLDEIEKGDYQPGSLIPTEAELSEIFDISRTTVRQAVTDLVKEGRLYRVKSKGTFVAKPKVEWEMENKLPSFSEHVIATGRTPSIKVLTLKPMAVPAELDLADYSFKSDKVIYLQRVRYADNDPLLHQHTYIDADKAGFVLNADFENNKLMQVLESSPQSKPIRIIRVAEAALAGKEDVELLKAKKGSAILKVTQYSFNVNGELVECTISRHRGDEGRMHTEFAL